MKSYHKAIRLTLLSLLCGIWVLWFYIPYHPSWYPTRLWILEFPSYSLLRLICLNCILIAALFLGRMAKKHATQAESKLWRGLASASTFLNVIILIFPVLNLISIFVPRTITRVVDYKIAGRYICVKEFDSEKRWGQEFDFDENTVVYEQEQKTSGQKETVSADAIEPGQVVEIKYFDKDTSPWGITASSITILEGQHRPFQNENCGSALP